MPGFHEVLNILIHADAHALAVPLQKAGLCSLENIRTNELMLRSIVTNTTLLSHLLGTIVTEDPIELFESSQQIVTDPIATRTSRNDERTSHRSNSLQEEASKQRLKPHPTVSRAQP